VHIATAVCIRDSAPGVTGTYLSGWSRRHLPDPGCTP